MKKYESIQEYLDSFEGVAKERLLELRSFVKEQLPDAEERISYNMPGYFLGKAILCYIAAYPKHVSIYPIHIAGEEMAQKFAPYRYGKSTARFNHDQPLPRELIKEFLLLRRSQV